MMTTLEDLKKDLASGENQLKHAGSQYYQLVGIVGYLKGKIKELETPKEPAAPEGEAKAVSDGS